MNDPVASFNIALAGKIDTWVPACGGREPVFEVAGQRLQYCWNPATGQHAYYSLDRDMILAHDELPDCLQ